MKKLTLLLAVSALALVGCNDKGKEIKDQEEINKATANINEKSTDIKNYEFKIKVVGSSYDVDLDKNVKRTAEYALAVNEDGDIHLTASSDDGEITTSTDFYMVNNATYTKVAYVDDLQGEERNLKVYGYEGHEMDFAFLSFYYAIPAAYYETFVHATEIDKAIPAQEAASYDVTTKYFSKGEGNLTIELNFKYTGEASEQEQPASGSYVVKYDGGYFKSAKVEQKSNKGNKSTTECSLTVKDKFAVNLPSGWEELINK